MHAGGEFAWLNPVGFICRVLEEADLHIERLGSCNVQPSDPVGQGLCLVGMLECAAEAVARLSLQRRPPRRLYPVPEAHAYGGAQARVGGVTRGGVRRPRPEAALPVVATL